MALTSPGVQVSVVDESFYTPAEPGTVPMIFVATAANKTNGAGTGIAPGSLKANAGKPYLLTSQRDLTETFGDPVFYTDTNNNPIHAGELNEYGLQAAYSLLGVSNRAFVVRADVDLGALQATADAPSGAPADGALWTDTASTAFGIFEWNGAAASTTGGQSFAVKTPIVITDATKTSGSTPYTPKGSVGAIGDYAVTAGLSTIYRVWYKNTSGNWVQVGSSTWTGTTPSATGTVVVTGGTSLLDSDTLVLDIAGANYTLTAATSGGSATSLDDIVTNSNTVLSGTGVSVANLNSQLVIYNDGSTDTQITLAEGAGTPGLAEKLGFTVGNYDIPALAIDPHTSVPQWKSTGSGQVARPSGSVWLKTTEPNSGARWRVKSYNADTALWDLVDAPIHASNQSALYALDKAGGGANLAKDALYVQSNFTEASSKLGDFVLFKRAAAGATTIKTAEIATQLSAVTYTFKIAESVVGSAALATALEVSFTATGASTDSDEMADGINSAGFTNIVASVDSDNKVVIEHKLGGDFRLDNGSGTSPLTLVGLTNAATNVYDAPTGDTTNELVASNWMPVTSSASQVYVASANAPTSTTADGTLWYSSVIDEVDMMVHNGTTWVGYKTLYSSSNGTTVSATQPSTPADQDLWVDTSDLENYPTIYRWNNGAQEWQLVDKSDQTTEDGVLFADARYGTTGGTTTVAPTGTITDLLTSDYLDPDAPDPALYPRGMLLWNTRRSGFNVKKFVRNSIDVTADNARAGDASMASYYPHRWVTESANQEDGSGSFGRKAQRKVVVQQLQATMNSNDDIRDDESRIFNLLATPGYPELIGEMVSLNFDRGLSAFIVGDSPARLTSDATSLNEWGQNVALAVEDNDDGLVSRDEYLGVFYPWGFTSDNAGNNVVVPPSHMMLRTIALSDQVSYPWFAPAGTRRGGITNATATGFIDNEGEFNSIALNEGQRDTLYAVNVNPITFINGAGLVAYGQKTRARGASSLDRINVARLVIYLRGQLNKLAKPYIFEPNDKITRDQIKQSAESLCLELVGARALYDFLVVCDESNNTPARIDRNELYLDIAIEPVKAVEFIYIPLRLKNTGEIAGL